MRQVPESILAVVGALLIAAPSVTLHTLAPADIAVQGDEKPKDCNANPEDPRCKEEKKY